MRFVAVVVALSLLALGSACSDRDEDPGTPSPTPTITATPTPLPSSSEVLREIQDALDVVAGFKVQLVASNFPLEGWGAVDGGIVTVGRDGLTAFADLVRAGDGGYSMILDAGQTYFRRDNCDRWKRVPGGGAAILAPFFFNANDNFATAVPEGVEAGRREKQVVLTLRMPQYGRVQVTVNTETSLPVRIFRDPASGQEPLEMLFSEWGTGPTFRTPAADSPEARPDRNLPC